MRMISLFLAAVLLAPAASPAERIPWNQSPERFAGKHVIVRLTSGTLIQGKWVSVTSTAFTINVEKTSNRRDTPHGLQSLPRSSIASVRAGKRRIHGRMIGVAAGFYSIAGIAGAATHSPEALQGGWGIAAVGVAAGGYLIGRAADHETHEVLFSPEDPPGLP